MASDSKPLDQASELGFELLPFIPSPSSFSLFTPF